MSLVELSSLTIGYPPQKRGGHPRIVASGIEASFDTGEFVCLLGPNGSGKSTLLRTITGIQPSLGGRVALDRQDPFAIGHERRALLVAIATTDPFASGWFTVSDIVAFGRYPYTDARNRLGSKDIDSIREALRDVGMEDLADRYFSELSDGEKQKALIARALAQDTPILVLDEPTVYLDAPSRIEIFHLARSLARQRGKALILSTHDLDLALAMADRLWILTRNHVFAQGIPEELVLNGFFKLAFSDGKAVFEPESATFRVPGDEPALVVSIESDDHVAGIWTARMADRLGFLVGEGRDADIVLKVRGKPPALSWKAMGKEGEETSLASPEELAAFLKKIASEP